MTRADMFDRAIARWLGIAARPGILARPMFPASPIGSRDRRLRGKARRNARRAA